MAKNKKDKKKDKKKDDKKPHWKNGSPYDPKTSLRGKQVKTLAKALTRITTKPQIGASRAQAKSLKKLLNYNLKSNAALTGQASANVSEYYERLGQSSNQTGAMERALAARLNADVSAGNTQAQSAIQQAGEGAAQRLSADQGVRRVQGSTARDQLQNMIAQEGSLAAREGAGYAAQAAGQGASYQAVQAQMAQANQMRGASALTDIARQGQQNAASIQSQYAPEIIKAKQQARDIRATKGDTRAQFIRQLIGEERDYSLSKGALGVDKAGLTSGANYARVAGKQNRKSARVSGRQSRKTINQQAANNARQAHIKGNESRKTIGQQQSGYHKGGKNSKGAKREARKKLAVAMATLQNAQRQHPKWSNQTLKNYLIDSQSISPRYARKALRKQKKGSRGQVGSTIGGLGGWLSGPRHKGKNKKH